MQKNSVNDTPLIVEEPVSVDDIVAAVDAQVTGIDDEKQKVSLSIRALLEEAEDAAEDAE